MKRGSYSILWACVIVATWVAIGYDYYDRHNPAWDAAGTYISNLEVVRFKSFTNETVELDGKHFEHCKFSGVTFVYRGKEPFLLEDNEIEANGKQIELKVSQGPQFAGAVLMQGLINVACRGRSMSCDFVRIDYAK